MNKNILWVLLGLLLIGGGYVLWSKSALPGLGGNASCTAETLLCPDGSTVSSSGPNCEFPACPGPVAESGSVRLTASINQGASAFGVQVFPLEVVEDSRCPIDVQCIQAGTTRVRTLIVSAMGRSTMTLTLGEPITTEAEEVTLTEVLPQPRSTEEIEADDYRFIFEIAKRSNTEINP